MNKILRADSSGGSRALRQEFQVMRQALLQKYETVEKNQDALIASLRQSSEKINQQLAFIAHSRIKQEEEETYRITSSAYPLEMLICRLLEKYVKVFVSG